MTVAQLEGFAAGVLGHTFYRVEGNTVYLNTMKDARKMCLALLKQSVPFTCYFISGITITIKE